MDRLVVPLARRRVDIAIIAFFLANLPWLLFPLLIIVRMGRAEHPFTRLAPAPAAVLSAAQALGGA